MKTRWPEDGYEERPISEEEWEAILAVFGRFSIGGRWGRILRQGNSLTEESVRKGGYYPDGIRNAMNRKFEARGMPYRIVIRHDGWRRGWSKGSRQQVNRRLVLLCRKEAENEQAGSA